MRLLPRYAKLPVSIPITVVSLFALMLVLWLQGGPTTIYTHISLLFSSYLVWGFFLPFIQGIILAISYRKIEKVIWALCMAAILIVCHFVLSNILYYSILSIAAQTAIPSWDEISTFLTPSLLARSVDFMIFFGLLSWINQTKTLSEERLELAKVQAQIDRDRLISLRNQFNPHFLFNTLHAIYSQIGVNNDNAKDITLKISELLRVALAVNDKEDHTLEEELDIMNQYLELELIRFKDRLRIEKRIDASCLEVVVPTMLLQPLLENAFKHGVALVEGDTYIAIELKEVDDFVRFTITNQLSAKSSHVISSPGLGLDNLKQRLSLYYGENFDLLTERDIKEFKVSLSIPVSK